MTAGSPEHHIRGPSHSFSNKVRAHPRSQTLLASFIFKKRQDLINWAVGAVTGQEDLLDVFVEMSPEAMPDLVLLIGKPKIAKQMAKDLADVKVGSGRLLAVCVRLHQSSIFHARLSSRNNFQ